MFGPDRLLTELKELGFEAQIVSANGSKFAVIGEYEVTIGQFLGRFIELGIEAVPDFPNRVASSIHVRANPQLLDKGDSIPKVRNIKNSKLGAEWRYWSHNFNWKDEKSARRLMNQIRGIFANV